MIGGLLVIGLLNGVVITETILIITAWDFSSRTRR
jgi:hypothetical protein